MVRSMQFTELLDALIQASGKMVLVDKLLPKLKQGGHKVGLVEPVRSAVPCDNVRSTVFMPLLITDDRCSSSRK